MSDPTTSHAWMTHVAVASLRGAFGADGVHAWSLACTHARHAPYVLDLLDHARPQAHEAMESII